MVVAAVVVVVMVVVIDTGIIQPMQRQPCSFPPSLMADKDTMRTAGDFSDFSLFNVNNGTQPANNLCYTHLQRFSSGTTEEGKPNVVFLAMKVT